MNQAMTYMEDHLTDTIDYSMIAQYMIVPNGSSAGFFLFWRKSPYLNISAADGWRRLWRIFETEINS